MSERVKALARAAAEADTEYRSVFGHYILEFEPLDIEQFWGVMSRLVKNIDSSFSVKTACHNLMCTFVYSSAMSEVAGWPDEPTPAWESAARFFARYQKITSDLCDKCWKMPGLERSDDGYGDLMDALPLAGREIVKGIMEDDIANYKQLEACVPGPLRDFILNGENYIVISLEDALRKAYQSIARVG